MRRRTTVRWARRGASPRTYQVRKHILDGDIQVNGRRAFAAGHSRRAGSVDEPSLFGDLKDLQDVGQR